MTTDAPHPDDTIVALSSAPGAAPRAIVRISGAKCGAILAALGAALPPPGRFEAVSLRLTDVFSPLPADLYFFRRPRSYTGQDLVELHTLGSPPLVERLIADILNAGARPAGPGEFTLRAFLAGKLDLPQAEAVHAVIEASSENELKTALAQLAGGVTEPLHGLRDDLLNLLADAEAALDFADEDIEFVGKDETLDRVTKAIARMKNLRRQLEARTVSGRPLRAVLVGEPNAGKSSLFNALSGNAAALVSPEAGTTRDYLAVSLLFDGINVELIDTAGWADAAGTIEVQAQRLGAEQSQHADIVLWCVEAGSLFAPSVAERLARTTAVVLRVQTKCDLRAATEGVASSTVRPNGIDEVRSELAEAAVSWVRPPLAPSQSRCRHHVDACLKELQLAYHHALFEEPAELFALALRGALQHLGEMVGAVYTNDLLDRIFSRFCIGK
ncbi:MAG: tRNA modification GTPase [Gemmataceae bacterium]